MKLKGTNFFMVLFCLMTFFSCKEEFEYDKITDIYVFSTESNTKDLVTTLGGTFSFTDASRGEYVREWTIDGPSYFTNNEDTVLTEHIAHVQFENTGVVPVKIQLDFGDEELNYDSTFYITVYDSAVTPDFEVVEIEGDYVESNGKYIMESGAFVTFKSTSKGQPDTFEWLTTLDQTVKDSVARIEFVKPGVYDIGLFASRKEPVKGTGNTIYKNGLIEVVPSTVPFRVDQMTQDEEGNIFVKFNRDLDLETITDSTINNFTIRDADNNVLTINHLAASGEVNNTIILFVDPTFSQLYVTYNHSGEAGDLQSIDGVKLEEFTDMEVEGYQHNFFTNGSFENGTYAPFNDGKWVGSGAMNVIKDATSAVDGDYYLQVDFEPYEHKNGNGSKLTIEMTEGYFPVSAEYNYTFEFYAKAVGNIRVLKVTLKDADTGDSMNKTFQDQLVDGEWVKITYFSNEPITKEFINTNVQFDFIAEPNETAQLLVDHLVFSQH
ncbi:hypothetical protein [Flammeovirga sp. SubArs3]|uniref:hypothetical protein n=1 Tax=Flammeovirga sp. SubArs3 TaxID=2995316 RepID=UPI00248B9E7E|nr:hypothetical protein [Flammeovirga sp. SubArs3]